MLPPSSSSNSEQCDRDVNVNSKKSAWRRPSSSTSSNGGAIESNHVMGMADSWPALGESSTAKSDPIKIDFTPVPVVANHHMKVNDQIPSYSRRKPTKLQTSGGGGSSSSNQVNGGPVSPQQMGHGQEPSPRDMFSPRDMNNNRNNSNWDHSSNSRGNGFSPHHPVNRRGNNGSGGGTHNGARHDPDRGSHSNDWNNPSPRHMPPPPPPPLIHHPRLQFVRLPPPPSPRAGAVPFIGPLPLARPFMGPPMGFPAEIPSPVFYVPAPPPHFVNTHPMGHTIPPAMFLNPADYQAQSAAVLKQIEYYFSNENLCKDMYLRKHMDEHGWVPVSLIAGFNRVKQCTQYIPNNISFILDSVRTSELVEVQGEKIRRHADWSIWILPTQSSDSSGPRSPAMPNVNCVVDHMQSMLLQEMTSSNSSGGQTLSEI